MALDLYPAATSVVAGGSIDIHAHNSPAGNVNLQVTRLGSAGPEGVTASVMVSEQVVPADASAGCEWSSAFSVKTEPGWRSGLYRVTLRNAGGETAFTELVVRPSRPGATSRTVVHVPFTTFAAYDTWGGRSLYGNEDPSRAVKVSFDRPNVVCSGYEVPFFSFLDGSNPGVEYCSSVDLHAEPELLGPYRLFVSIGHDEYWSAEMRNAVEAFVAGGGNAAFLSANTCWWQVRFEDDNRTMVCYKDAALDPVTATSPQLATVRWSHAPVFRPENSLTGVSFRAGAGCWDDTSAMASAAYTTRFAGHWAFDGTRLADGDHFALGCVGYETDAADYDEVAGIPWATGRDGTPPDFVVLATAELGDWRRFGQGGGATMGIYHRGGTVFTAATIGWSNGLGQPVVSRITRNVLSRLAGPWPDHEWEVVGEATGVTAMAFSENKLFATTNDDRLFWRPPAGQNLHWTAIGVAQNVLALAAPTEVAAHRPIKLFAVNTDNGGTLWWRDPLTADNPWQKLGDAAGVRTLAALNDLLFATTGNELQSRSSTDNAAAWSTIGEAPSIVAMTALNGRLYAATGDHQLLTRDPVTDDVPWSTIGTLPATSQPLALAGAGGRLFLAGADNLLWWSIPPVPGA